MKKLKELVDKHTSLVFPSHPDSDELEDWILDLAEFDGHYIGLAKSVLGSKKIGHFDLSDLKKMKEKLRDISVESEKDKKLLKICESYINSLEKIIFEINRNHEN